MDRQQYHLHEEKNNAFSVEIINIVVTTIVAMTMTEDFKVILLIFCLLSKEENELAF